MKKIGNVSVWGLPSRTEVRTASTISSVRSSEIEKIENIVVDNENGDVKILEKNEKNSKSLSGTSSSSKNDRENMKIKGSEKDKMRDEDKNRINEKINEKSVGMTGNILMLSPVSEALRRSLCVNLRGLVKRLKVPQSSATALHALTLLHR